MGGRLVKHARYYFLAAGREGFDVLIGNAAQRATAAATVGRREPRAK